MQDIEKIEPKSIIDLIVYVAKQNQMLRHLGRSAEQKKLFEQKMEHLLLATLKGL